MVSSKKRSSGPGIDEAMQDIAGWKIKLRKYRKKTRLYINFLLLIGYYYTGNAALFFVCDSQNYVTVDFSITQSAASSDKMCPGID